MVETSERRRFEDAVLPHLDAAYNLARWLAGNGPDAEDIVQEACCRALRYFASFRGGDGRTWLLQIIRHTCYTWLRQHRGRELATSSIDDHEPADASEAFNPEKVLERRADHQRVRQAIEGLPAEFREAVVLRELEGLSYQQIATVAGIPLGTVMSRLARARKQLQRDLAGTLEPET